MTLNQFGWLFILIAAPTCIYLSIHGLCHRRRRDDFEYFDTGAVGEGWD